MKEDEEDEDSYCSKEVDQHVYLPMSESIMEVQCRLHSRVPKEEKLCLL